MPPSRAPTRPLRHVLAVKISIAAVSLSATIAGVVVLADRTGDLLVPAQLIVDIENTAVPRAQAAPIDPTWAASSPAAPDQCGKPAPRRTQAARAPQSRC